jgi:hypothetical protein
MRPHADNLLASIAAFGDAKELELLDVVSGQKEARLAIDSVIDNISRTQAPGLLVSRAMLGREKATY